MAKHEKRALPSPLPYDYEWSGERLRQALERSGMTQEALATASGQSTRAIRHWMAGTEPEAWRSMKLADALGCGVRDFYLKVNR